MSGDFSRAIGAISRIGHDDNLPIGTRLRQLDSIIAAATSEQRRLSMQLGMDMAKALVARGIAPSGRTVGEILEHEDGVTR